MELIEEIKRAVEYTRVKEYKKAEKLYLELLKQHPDNSSVLSFLGVLYFNNNNYKKAEKYLEKSYQISESKTIVSYLGLSKFFLTKYRQSIPYIEKALEDSKTYELFTAILQATMKYRDFKLGYQYGVEACNLFPADKRILYYTGYHALQTGRFSECEEYCKKVLMLDSKSTQGWFLKGLLNETLYGDEKSARDCYRNMVKFGDKLGGYMNLATSYLKHVETRDKAYYYLKKVRSIKSNKSGLSFLFASYFLSKRQFEKGYKYYVDIDDDTQDDKDWSAQFKRPWVGGQFKDEVLFVYGDQGLGDQIQFSRYLPFLEKKFKEIRVMVAEPLYGIFERSFSGYKNIKFYKRSNKFPKYNKSVMMAFLIYYLNKRFNNIPFTGGYFAADGTKVQEYKSKYFQSSKRKIGICWEAGAANIREQLHRTLNIELFENIINMKDADIYSLQFNPSLDNYKKYKNIIDLGSMFKDFDDTAAALMNLDVLVTVDTSVAHLAGALGVKTFLILPYCPDWRWFDNDKTTEWYDSVTIFKQQNHDDWDEVFERIAKQLG